MACEEIYGKAMSIGDDLMPEYYRLATSLSSTEVNAILGDLKNEKLHPRDAKMRLAREIVALYHGSEAAAAAEERFKQVFQKGEMPTEMPGFDFNGPLNIINAMVDADLAPTKSEARRLIQQNGVKIDGETVTSIELELTAGLAAVLQVGKRKFVRINIT